MLFKLDNLYIKNKIINKDYNNKMFYNYKKFNKKAQDATNPQTYIALLIFVITIALVVYILMIPPADRAELLEQNRTNPYGTKSSIKVILTKQIGTLSNLIDNEKKLDFPSFTLFSRTDTITLIDFDTIYVKKSLYEEQSRNITFSIKDVRNTDNYILSFTIPKHKGILTILLNDNILTSEEFQTESPPPIRLPKDYLKEKNTLVFKVSGPGAEFWNYNEYLIKNLKIYADLTDNSGIINKQIFVLTEQEQNNLESFSLSFVADCKAGENSPLSVYLNKRLIYSTIPDCGQLTKVAPQEPSRLKQGENDLTFSINNGFYDVYAVEAKLKLKKPIYPTYYFYIDDDTFYKIKNNQVDINITLDFTNEEDYKSGVIFVNEYKTEIDTDEKSYSRLLNNFIRKGNNAIEIRPKSDKIEILEMNLILAE
ncbi:MAG: hypothetical protein QXM96_03570 [Candidatus Woesearchaeota archaeon]